MVVAVVAVFVDCSLVFLLIVNAVFVFVFGAVSCRVNSPMIEGSFAEVAYYRRPILCCRLELSHLRLVLRIPRPHHILDPRHIDLNKVRFHLVIQLHSILSLLINCSNKQILSLNNKQINNFLM